MTRFLVYAGLFLILIGIETGLLTSLPFSHSFVPFVLAFALSLFHIFSSRIGLWYILVWGIWYDVFGLSLWSPLSFIALFMVAGLFYAGERLFSRQSLYGLFGMTFVAWGIWTVLDAAFRLTSQEPFHVAFDHFFITQTQWLLELLFFTSCWFLVFLRFRKVARLV